MAPTIDGKARGSDASSPAAALLTAAPAREEARDVQPQFKMVDHLAWVRRATLSSLDLAAHPHP